MSQRSVYLTKYRASASLRAHFAIFIPNRGEDRSGLGTDYRDASCLGTVINVVGEPLMMGFVLEIERNSDCSTARDLKELVFIGSVDESSIYEPTTSSSVKGDIPRGRLEVEASRINPPPRGQNIRLPIDGISTKRCQEWTMDYVDQLVRKGLINPEAASIVQAQRDPPSHGIFGLR